MEKLLAEMIRPAENEIFELSMVTKRCAQIMLLCKCVGNARFEAGRMTLEQIRKFYCEIGQTVFYRVRDVFNEAKSINDELDRSPRLARNCKQSWPKWAN